MSSPAHLEGGGGPRGIPPGGGKPGRRGLGQTNSGTSVNMKQSTGLWFYSEVDRPSVIQYFSSDRLMLEEKV